MTPPQTYFSCASSPPGISYATSVYVRPAHERAIPASPAIAESMGYDHSSGVSFEGGNNQRCLVSHIEVVSGDKMRYRGMMEERWGRSDLVCRCWVPEKVDLGAFTCHAKAGTRV
jgi:hypothetical protein